MNDKASLQNLNDIVEPAAAAWWPPAPGWYVLAAILLVLLCWQAFRSWRRWRLNAYRRQALAELSTIRTECDETRLREVPGLLKRSALSVWPRESVASLSGAAWHRFLDTTGGMGQFADGAGRVLDQLAYLDRQEAHIEPADSKLLLDAAESWLKQHRRPAESA